MRLFTQRIEKYLPVLLIVIVFMVNIPLARTQLLSPDASEYLDIGRNLVSGQTTFSYNLYQYWQDKTYPSLPFMHPIFPLIAGTIWVITKSIAAVISFNVLLLALNCFVLYKLLRLYTNPWISFLTAMYQGFSPVVVFSAIYPWTEQLHLLFILSAVYLYLKSDHYRFAVGIILGLSCLVRFASFYSVFAFGVALLLQKGFSKSALKEYLNISLGFLAVFLGYEAFCYFNYGIFYPEYILAGKNFKIAMESTGGIYTNNLPILKASVLNLSQQVVFDRMRLHLSGFLNNFGELKYFLFLLPGYLIYNQLKLKRPLVNIFFFQGFWLILFHVITLTWCPQIDTKRYSLIPYVAWSGILFLALSDFSTWLAKRRNSEQFSWLIFALCFTLLFALKLNSYTKFREFYLTTYPQNRSRYQVARDEIYQWIRNNTESDVLVASAFMRDGFLFERAFVSLPQGKARNERNIIDFLRIYEPDYVLTSDSSILPLLKNQGFREKKISAFLILLGR